MKKCFLGFVAMVVVALMSSCTDYNAELTSNVSKWNSGVSAMNTVYNMVEQVSTPSGFSILSNRVESGQKYFDEAINTIQTTSYSPDAEAMNTALVDYMTVCKNVLSVYKQLSDNADNLTDEDIAKHEQSLDSLHLILDKKEDIVGNAQMEYAKKHGLSLQTVEQ